MDIRDKNSSVAEQKTEKKNVDEIIRENLALMQNIQKNRMNFCQLVGGC
jgi:hypothetical protein